MKLAPPKNERELRRSKKQLQATVALTLGPDARVLVYPARYGWIARAVICPRRHTGGHPA